MQKPADYDKLSPVIKMNQLKGSLALLLGTLIWGMAFVAQSVGMDLIGPFTFQAIRCALGVLFLLAVSLLLGLKEGFRTFISKWKNRKLWRCGIICGAALFVATSLQQLGLVYTEPGKAGFLTAMYIVLVPLLGFFIHQKPGVSAVFSVLLSLAGLYLLSFSGAGGTNIGDLLMIACAFAFAVQILFIDRYAQDMDGIRLNCAQALVVSVLSIPGILLNRETVAFSNIISCWLPLFFAGVLSMGVGYTLQIVGQKHLEPTAASLIMSLESVFSALGEWLILHNTMTFKELAGCALMFAGVVISQLPFKKIFSRSGA